MQEKEIARSVVASCEVITLILSSEHGHHEGYRIRVSAAAAGSHLEFSIGEARAMAAALGSHASLEGTT